MSATDYNVRKHSICLTASIIETLVKGGEKTVLKNATGFLNQCLAVGRPLMLAKYADRKKGAPKIGLDNEPHVTFSRAIDLNIWADARRAARKLHITDMSDYARECVRLAAGEVVAKYKTEARK